MSRPRAADDFPMIRARMEELRRERIRPRAADDFPSDPGPHGGTSARTRSAIGRKKEPFGDPPEALSSRREEWIGPKAEAAPHASATARRAPMVRAAN